MKTAADRTKAAEAAFRAYQRTQIMPAYNARFTSYLIAADDYKQLLASVKASGMTPRAIIARLTTEKWLLTAEQGVELEAAGQNSMHLLPASTVKGEPIWYELVSCRVLDRMNVPGDGARGYYLHELGRPFYTETVDVSQFKVQAEQERSGW